MDSKRFDWKGLLNWIAIILTIITGSIALYLYTVDFIKSLINDNYIEKSGFNKISYTFFILLPVSILSCIFLIKKHLVSKGVWGEPYKFRLLVKRLNPFLSSHLVKDYHDLYHLIEDKRNFISKNRNLDPLSKIGRTFTSEILQRFNYILKTATSVDFSINIKLFVRNDALDEGFVSFDKAILKTYERFECGSEKTQIQNGLRKRTSTENYVVQHWEADEKDQLYEMIKGYRGNYVRNLAYDYSLGPLEHYWLSNNLENDEKKCRFCSTSRDYKNYYSSLGVFLIAPPLVAGEHIINKDKVLGLIVFDSKESNVFHKIFTRHILGYFSHLIYDYLMYYSLFNRGNGRPKS